VSVDHYENFPVASVLCPPALRPAVHAIYRFARAADDIADEGDATGAERRTRLDVYEQRLLEAAAGRIGRDWPEVFGPLARQIEAHRLPLPLLRDLISAFRQDTHNPIYPDRAALLDYCGRSANPIGRLLLHLCAIDEPEAHARSDAVCSALQLINFWQDLSVDLPRGRVYLPQSDLRHHGLDVPLLLGGPDAAASRSLVRDLVQWAQALMAEGAPLALRLPGRTGWELRLVVQGGLRILEKIAAMNFTSARTRPVLRRGDAPLLLWRALRMAR
jgi:squalene synthase HpnC